MSNNPSISELISQELSVLREKYLFSVDETLQDPVFEGVVRNFNNFNECLIDLFSRINRLTSSIENVSAEIGQLSDSFLDKYRLAVPEEQLIISDCYKFRESSNQIGRGDAPHTAVAKFKRDLEYNVIGPLRAHLNNCRQIKGIIDLRTRKMIEVSAAEKRGDVRVARDLRIDFEKVDKHLFDWMMILEEYRGDILDSLLQTMKYLQYEFFAQSAHAVAAVLPKRMEFRPMVEMTPKQLEVQLGLDKVADQEEAGGTEANADSVTQAETTGYVGSGKRGISDYSKLLIQKIEKSSPTSGDRASSSSSNVTVDILSLSSLLAQGFEEGPARKALRECNNDTQAALDILLGNRESPVVADDEEGEDGVGGAAVRMPTTLKRIKRIKEMKQRMQAKKEQKEKAASEPPSQNPPATANLAGDLLQLDEPQDFTSLEYQKPKLPDVEDLLFG